jgi:GAF domain-containing protein
VRTADNSYNDEIAELGSLLLRDHTVDGVLTKVVDVAVRSIPSASSVSVTLTRDGGFVTSHCSDREALVLDEAQYEASAGPTLEAIKRSERVTSAHEADVDVWSSFCQRAQDIGVVGSMSTPLLAGDTTYGALNVYTRRPDDFSADDIELADTLAEQASIVVANATAFAEAASLNDQLREALASREVIGEAKGILIAREGCTRDEAFDMLRRASQRENRKLRQIAEDIVQRAERRMSHT